MNKMKQNSTHANAIVFSMAYSKKLMLNKKRSKQPGFEMYLRFSSLLTYLIYDSLLKMH